MEDTLAVLLDAAIGSPMTTPAPAAAAADEIAAFMESAAPSSRRSIQPPVNIQTPEPATGRPPAASRDAAPAIALPPTASPLPMPDHLYRQAEIEIMEQRRIATADEQARVQAAMQVTLQEQAAGLIAQAAELKYQALLMQMKEAAHTAAMERMGLEMQLAAATAAAALANAQAAATHAAAVAAANGIAAQEATPVVTSRTFLTTHTKIVAANLLTLSVSDSFTSRIIGQGSTIAEIDAIILAMLNALSAVPGQLEFGLLLGIIFGLPLQHVVVVPGSITGQNVQRIIAILAGFADGADGSDEDATSSSSSLAPRKRRRTDIFGSAQHRAAYARLVQLLAGDEVPLSLGIMQNWKVIDLGLLNILKGQVPATTPYLYSRVQSQSSFVAALQQVLFIRGQSVRLQLETCFEDLVGSCDYTGPDGTFDLVTASGIMHGLISDLEQRSRACRTVMENQHAFCLSRSLKHLPAFHGGSLERVFHDLTQKLNMLIEDSATMDDIIGAIHEALSLLGADELSGDIQAPSPLKKLPTGKVAESAMAAVQPIRGGSKGKFRNQGAANRQPTEAAPLEAVDNGPPMPPGKRLCAHGPNCPRFGTMEICTDWHLPKDIALIQQKLAGAYISGPTRRAVLALRQAERAAATIPPIAPQPAAPQPVPAAEETLATRAQVLHNVLKQAQQNFSGCAAPTLFAPVHAAPSRLAAQPDAGSTGAAASIPVSPIIAADSKQPAPAVPTTHIRVERTDEPMPTVLGVSRPVREHRRLLHTERIAAHAKPACTSRN